MFDRIERGLWWDRAWTLVKGCTPVSPACDNCWLSSETHMRASNPNEKIKADNAGLCSGGHFNGTVRLMEKNLDLPLRVKRPTAWAIWSDLFHENVPFEFINRAMDTISICESSKKGHVFFILTKRPERMLEYAKSTLINHSNVFWGTTVENQEQADKRIPLLLQIPWAKKRFVSVEPILGPVNLFKNVPAVLGTFRHLSCVERIQWVICGGESGKQARPVHPDWVRSIRDQCQSYGVPLFFKQWGEWGPAATEDQSCPVPTRNKCAVYKFPPDFKTTMCKFGKKAAGRVLDGSEYLELPKTVSVEAEKPSGW